MSAIRQLDTPQRSRQRVPRRLPTGRRAARRAGDRYSRLVALLKLLLPAIGLGLLLLVAIWPELNPLLERVRLGIPAIDLREARELKMVNPRYAGLDHFNRPFLVTAAIGRQVPSRDDLMSLEQARADLTMHNGAAAVVTAASGIYQSQAQLLDLFKDVNLFHDDGTHFVTQSARVNLAEDTASGHDPVEGHGPSGDIAAQGFVILDKGDTILFTGRANLLLKGTKALGAPKEPPTIPPDVARAAAQIEAAATAPAATSQAGARHRADHVAAHPVKAAARTAKRG